MGILLKLIQMLMLEFIMKHRIYVAKNLLPTLTKAEVTNSDYRGKSLTFYEVGEMWCIELPFSFLSEKNSSSYKYVVMYF